MLDKIFLLLSSILIFSNEGFSQCYIKCSSNTDTSVNKVSLQNINEILPDLVNMNWDKINSIDKSKNEIPFEPMYFIYQNTYLMVAGLEGTGLCYFEMGYNFKSISKRSYIKVKQPKKFITNNGIFLGIKEVKFIELLSALIPEFSIQRTDNISEYSYSCADGINEGYYQQGANILHRPDYIARYIFKDGVLVKFGFGYLPFHPTLSGLY